MTLIMDGHGLLLPFDTDDPQFARGFELGHLWALLRELTDESVTELVHVSNAEMLIRTAEATGRNFAAKILTDTWLEITFAPVGELVAEPDGGE
jgi:hypothetical protein